MISTYSGPKFGNITGWVRQSEMFLHKFPTLVFDSKAKMHQGENTEIYEVIMWRQNLLKLIEKDALLRAQKPGI